VDERAGSEADDSIGTLATSARAIDSVSIVTGDLDALQLVRGTTVTAHIFRHGSELTVFDERAVIERYGLPPHTLIEYKALVGDSSDNIPGVPGIGPKTATKLLLAHHTIEGIYQSLETITEPLQKTLTLHREQVLLARELATIDCAVPIETSLAAYVYKKPPLETCVAYYEKLGFSSLVKRLMKTRETPLL
jgi:DNA polymerase-1